MISKPLSKTQVASLIRQSKFHVKQLVDLNPEKTIQPHQVSKLLQISGLKPDPNTDFVNALNVQLSFIKKLYKEDDVISKSNNDNVFRLIQLDHRPQVQNLANILKQIDELDNEVDREKGEIDFKKQGFFSVRKYIRS